ncbi:MAG: TIGR03086 family metal-binding protein [Acidimicrobiia bacterium]
MEREEVPSMDGVAERYRRVAGDFTATVEAVPADRWESPAPCEGWVARDVVGHLVGWVPAFLAAGGGPVPPSGPAVADDPAGAWRALDDGIQAVLDDPVASAAIVDHPRAGARSYADTVAMFFLGDVLVHTWDLARATGLEEALDPVEVAAMLAGMEPLDEMLRSSGQYGPRVPVPDGADLQTRLIAFTGRRP